jgi:citrate synthase
MWFNQQQAASEAAQLTQIKADIESNTSKAIRLKLNLKKPNHVERYQAVINQINQARATVWVAVADEIRPLQELDLHVDELNRFKQALNNFDNTVYQFIKSMLVVEHENKRYADSIQKILAVILQTYQIMPQQNLTPQDMQTTAGHFLQMMDKIRAEESRAYEVSWSGAVKVLFGYNKSSLLSQIDKFLIAISLLARDIFQYAPAQFLNSSSSL